METGVIIHNCEAGETGESSNPTRIHQDDSPSVRVFKSSSLLLPVWIFRLNGEVAYDVQPLCQASDRFTVRNIEDKEIVFGWCRARAAINVRGELKMILVAGQSQHHA